MYVCIGKLRSLHVFVLEVLLTYSPHPLTDVMTLTDTTISIQTLHEVTVLINAIDRTKPNQAAKQPTKMT